ncbi:hypothetical protein LJC16_03940 [Bacteroidales bacterium OttesenSCG-928-C19]|nr:hypothetical protein [Bacteroidales bacterium OttesenSCG-928-C19]
MKKISFILLLCVFILSSCKKDEESYPKELDFKQMFRFIGISPYAISNEFKGIYDTTYHFVSPHIENIYSLVTEEKIYRVSFNFSNGNSLDKFTVSVKESYKTAGSIVSFVEKLSKRASNASPKIEADTYYAEYTNVSSSIKSYDNRESFWSDVSSKEIERLSEHWILTRSDGVSVRFEIRLEFDNNLYKLYIYGQVV